VSETQSPRAARSTDEHLIRQARERTRSLLEHGLARLGGSAAAARIEVRFDLRGQTAGQVRIQSRGGYLIRYNLELLRRGGDDFLARTVPHEVAHVLAHQHFGATIRPHGREWQSIMRALGAEPTRCHDYDVTGLAQRRLSYFDYHCGCTDHRLTSIRHNRIAKGQRYHCRRCGEPLQRGRRDE
jgi:SprT protein